MDHALHGLSSGVNSSPKRFPVSSTVVRINIALSLASTTNNCLGKGVIIVWLACVHPDTLTACSGLDFSLEFSTYALCIMARDSDFNVPYWLAGRHDCEKTRVESRASKS